MTLLLKTTIKKQPCCRMHHTPPRQANNNLQHTHNSIQAVATHATTPNCLSIIHHPTHAQHAHDTHNDGGWQVESYGCHARCTPSPPRPTAVAPCPHAASTCTFGVASYLMFDRHYSHPLPLPLINRLSIFCCILQQMDIRNHRCFHNRCRLQLLPAASAAVLATQLPAASFAAAAHSSFCAKAGSNRCSSSPSPLFEAIADR